MMETIYLENYEKRKLAKARPAAGGGGWGILYPLPSSPPSVYNYSLFIYIARYLSKNTRHFFKENQCLYHLT
jgi:hypothetical protein